ncbi:hypothetical protein HMSSN139_12020 [Paenibacillus sp. HMSSN-139]|nr:hypothetical protein HMSSN139_12020 [Paenibacillus sp. HMSSN-139]
MSVYDLLNPNKSEIYFDDLRRIVVKYWSVYDNIFTMEKQDFDSMMSAINRFRADAHAKQITDDQMDFFRVCITTIENKIG